MFIDKLDQRDRKIFTGAVVLFLLFSSLTIWDGWIYKLTQKDLGDLQQIGSVTTSENDVRRRYKVAFSWAPLKVENAVYQGDSIFTGDNSEAIVKTEFGEEIIIAANSLVVINSKKDSISIDIGFGSIEGKVGKGKKLLISSNNQLTELDGSNATIKIDAGDGENGKLLLNVLEGEVEVRSGDGVTTLSRNDAAELDAGGLRSPKFDSITLGTPLAEQRFRYAPEEATQFTWKSDRNYPRMKIKVADNPELNNALVDEPVNSSSYVAFRLPSDRKLYWQILAEGAQSQVGSFWLLEDKPPTPVLPQQGEQYFYDATLKGKLAGTDVTLQWQGGSPARKYQVQLATDQLFTKIISDKKPESNTVLLGKLPESDYYWRVRGLEFPNAPWSEVAFFKVGPEPTKELAPPRPQMDRLQLITTKLHGQKASKLSNLSEYGYRKFIDQFPSIVWSKVSNASSYDLQIAKSPKFESPIVSVEVKSNRFTWRSATPGLYYWRIRARGEGYLDGTFSAARAFKVEVSAPLAISQQDYIDEVPDPILLKAPPPPLNLEWNPTVFSKSYEVILSADPKFSDPLRFVTQRSRRELQLPKPGKYYWRVRAFGRNNTPVSGFSEVNTLQFKRVYRDPALSENLVALSPKQGESILMIGDGKSEILFEWNKPLKKASYELEMAYDVSFQKIAYRVKTPNSRVAFKRPLASSIVYWRVRGVTEEGSTPWTGANRFLVSYEKTPFDIDTSERMHYARQKARERQEKALAAIQRKLRKLRTPAGTLDIQLDAPLTTFAKTELIIEENIPSSITSLKLAAQPDSKNYKLMKNRPVLTWGKVQAAERYFIEIAQDPNFTSVIIKAPSFNPYFLWETARPGQFYWRVQAFNSRYTRSNFSRVQSLRVKTAPPVAISPDNFVEVFNEPPDMWPPPAPFTLQWTPRLFAKAYEVEFSEKADFSLSKVFKTDEAKREFHVSKTGTYFWRVRPVNSAGFGISEWAPARSVEVAQTQRSPASVDRITGLFPLDRTMLFVGKGLMNLVFHFVSPTAQDSIIEVATDKNFNTVVARAPAKNSKVRISKELPEGLLYWRIGSNDASIRGPASSSTWSNVYKFMLRKEPEPYIIKSEPTLK